MSGKNQNKQSPSTEKNKNKASSQCNSVKERGRGKAYLFFLGIIVFGVSVTALYKVYSFHQQATQQAQTLLSDIDLLKKQQANTTFQLESAIKERESTDAQLRQVEQHLQSALQQRLYQANDWLLLKARYYLELAQINAHWSDDFASTVGLLKQTDTLLLTLHDMRLLAVRQAIAKEISAIQALPKIDISGILSQLDALQQRVDTLRVKEFQLRPEEIAAGDTQKTASSFWRERLQDSMHVLGKLIVVRRHDKAIEPMISLSQEVLLRESLRLKLQEAQWAVLQRNPIIYQLALEQASRIIKRTFDDKGGQNMVRELASLQNISLAQEKPAMGSALSLLNALIHTDEVKKMPAKSHTAGEKK